MKKFYNRELFIDLLERKAINPISQLKEVQGSFHILAGFVLESFIERRINSNNKIKDNILKWILRDSPTELEKILDINEIIAVVIGSGHAKRKYPDIFSPANPNIDIIF